MRKNKLKTFLFLCLLGGQYSCSPIKSVPQEQRHQLELTLHDLQTNLDDLRHDLHCYQSELQILDSKIQQHENLFASVKQNIVPKQQEKIDHLAEALKNQEKQLLEKAKIEEQVLTDLRKLSSHANEMTNAFSQYKSRMNDIENQMLRHNNNLEEMKRLRNSFENLVHSIKGQDSSFSHYRVKSGDSLEKIAKKYRISIDDIKQCNQLDTDLIVIGQELKIPQK